MKLLAENNSLGVCPNCGKEYEADSIYKIEYEDDTVYKYAYCAKCRAQIEEVYTTEYSYTNAWSN